MRQEAPMELFYYDLGFYSDFNDRKLKFLVVGEE